MTSNLYKNFNSLHFPVKLMVYVTSGIKAKGSKSGAFGIQWKEIERSEMKSVYVKEGITSLIQVE